MEFLQDTYASLSAKIGNLLPGVLGALVVLIIGLFLARVIRNIVMRLLGKTNVDEKLGKKLNMSFRMDRFLAKIAYYLVVLYTLLIVLGMMGLDSVLAPIEGMLGEFLSFLPNFIAAGIIGFAGYLLATIASEATGFLSNSLESFTARAGVKSSISLSRIVKQLVFILVFLPILIVALDTLNLTAISEPATEMLSTFLNAIPNILAAALIIALFYIAGKFVVGLLKELLQSLGTDQFSQDLGINRMIGQKSLSNVIGNVAFFFLLFTGIIAGAERLGLTALNDILNTVFDISGQIFFGMVILGVGAFIANLAGDTLAKSDSEWMAPIARFAVIGVFLAFALHTMGIAESIVNLAFGLTLGAAAVAFALAFGLGGREAAGKQLDQFFTNINKGTMKAKTRNGKVKK